MPLCDICSNNFQRIERAPARGPEGKKRIVTLLVKPWLLRERLNEGCLVAFLHPSFDALSSSITEGRRTSRICEFCEMIHDILLQTETRRSRRAQRPKFNLKFDLHQWLTSAYDMDSWGLLDNEPPRLYKRIVLNRSMRKSQTVWLKYDGSDQSLTYISVGRQGMQEMEALLVMPHQWADQFPTGEHGEQGGQGEEFDESFLLLSDSSTASPRAFLLIINWVLECFKNHPNCRQCRYITPTRLLDLQPDGRAEQIALVNGESLSSPPYATLSHRWGKDFPPLQTNTKNEISHRMGIAISSLPKTFQDAVLVARALSLRYLWIDSLCIIQDSEQDKATELPSMGDYYYGSAFNISADAAQDSREGLFYPRNGASLRPQSLTCDLDNHPSKKQTWTVTLDLNSPHNLRPSTTTDSVLYKRGWVFQEQLFARRTLHFGKGSIYFSCFTTFASETLPKGVPLHDPNLGFLSTYKRSGGLKLYQEMAHVGLAIQTSKLMETVEENTGDALQNSSSYQHGRFSLYFWYKAIERYSHRELTFENDRLSAISGLAEVFAKHNSDEYVADLWKGDLISGLCWSVLTPSENISGNLVANSGLEEKQANFQEASQDKPRRKYIAPSWSWASKCPARMNYHDSFLGHKQLLVHTAATVIEVHAHQSTPNRYGEVNNDTYLKVFARLITTIRVRSSKKKARLIWHRQSKVSSNLPDIKSLKVEWDSRESLPKGSIVYILPLRRGEDPNYSKFRKLTEDSNFSAFRMPIFDSDYFQGIVLVRNANGNFQREGYATFRWTCAAFNSLEEKEITIV